jgi:hypothetical protein
VVSNTGVQTVEANVHPKLRKEIQDLENKHNGEITAEIVFEASKKAGTALYKYLDTKDVWDKDKAQQHYGVQVCRELIRRVKIVEETDEYSVRIRIPQYVRNPDAEHLVQSMININALKSDKNRLREVLIPYVQRAASNIQTAIHLSDDTGCTEMLEEVRDALHDVIEKIRRKNKPTKSRSTASKAEIARRVAG